MRELFTQHFNGFVNCYVNIQQMCIIQVIHGAREITKFNRNKREHLREKNSC